MLVISHNLRSFRAQIHRVTLEWTDFIILLAGWTLESVQDFLINLAFIDPPFLKDCSMGLTIYILQQQSAFYIIAVMFNFHLMS